MHGKKRARRCSFRSSDRGVRSQLTSTNPQMSRPPIREAKQQSRCCSKPPMRLVFGAQAAADSRFPRESRTRDSLVSQLLAVPPKQRSGISICLGGESCLLHRPRAEEGLEQRRAPAVRGSRDGRSQPNPSSSISSTRATFDSGAARARYVHGSGPKEGPKVVIGAERTAAQPAMLRGKPSGSHKDLHHLRVVGKRLLE